MTQNFFPLTLNQLDIYFDQTRQPNNPLYNVGGYIALENVDVTRLRQAHAALVSVDDAFGLNFHSRSNPPMQFVLQTRNVELPVLDFSGSAAPYQEATAWLNNRMRTPFCLHDGSFLYDSYLLKLTESHYWYLGMAHHLIMDGWGFSNWANKLADLYNNPETEFPEFNWSEHVLSDQEYVQSVKYQKDEQYWQSVCSAMPEPLFKPRWLAQFASELPIPGGRTVVDLDPEDYQNLQMLTREWDVSLPTLLLALVATYLYRAKGQSDLFIGTLSHNRRGKAQKSALGMFTGVTPLRTEIDRQQTLRQLAKVYASAMKDCFRHQRFPLGHMRRIASSGRETDQFVETCFNYLELDQSLAFSGVPAQLNYCSNGYESLPLKFIVWADAARKKLSFQLDYNCAWFSENEVSALGERLKYMVRQCRNWSDLPLSQISIIPDAELSKLQCLAGESSQPLFPKQGSILQALEHNAIQSPNSVAVEVGAKTITYSELLENVGVWVAKLRGAGVRKGHRVGVMLPRGSQLIEMLLALLKVGASYVGLDAKYPWSRLQYMVADCSMSALVSTAEFDYLTEKFPVEVWNLESHWQGLKDSDAVARDEQIAYLIYTSGSTGQPKGVEITTEGLSALIGWAQVEFTAVELQRVLFSTSLNFDLSSFEIFVPLVSGGTVVIVESALSLLDQPVEVSLINTVPSAIQALLQHKAISHSVATINLAGEALPQSTVNQLLSETSCLRVLNLYGPSEDTTYSTAAEFRSALSSKPHIGRPIPGTKCYVLDSEQKMLPIGETGELYLAGAGLANGYCTKPELTAEKFVHCSLDGNVVMRLYATGDLVRWRSDGNLDYIGRKDSQVKLRGFRIELGEIEQLILQLSNIALCKVLLWQPQGNQFLVAFYSLMDEQKQSYTEEQVKSHLQSKLPGYMTPDRIIALQTMPVSANGKIDAKALQELQLYDSITEMVPDCAIEKALLIIWQELLADRQITLRSNFFQSGGHSLLALQMLASVDDKLGHKVSLQTLFKAPTIAELAKVIKTEFQQNDTFVITKQATKSVHPLTPIQHRIWRSQQMDPDTTQNVIGGYVDISGSLDINQLRTATDGLLRRFPELRINIIEIDGNPRQRVKDFTCDQIFKFVDLVNSDSYEDVEHLIQQLSHQLKHIADAPLWQILVIRVGRNTHRLCIAMHHVISDGWSVARFIEALLKGYINSETTETVGHEDRELLTFFDYVHWQAELQASFAYQQQASFWLDYLAEAPSAAPLPKLDPFASEIRVLEVSKQLVAAQQLAALTKFTEASEGSMFHLVYCALCLAIQRLTGQNDVVIALPVTGRHIPQTNNMLGVFLNLLPARSKIQATDSLRQFLENSVANIRQLLSNQDYAIDAIENDFAHSNGSQQLFNVALNMLNIPNINLAMPGLEVSDIQELEIENKFDLTLYVTLEKQSVDVKYVFASDKVDEATILILNQHMEAILQAFISKPSERIASLSDGNQSSDSCSRLAIDKSQDFNPATLLQRHAQKIPIQLACMDSKESLSYAELWGRIEQVAAGLRQNGVNKSDRVAVYAVRSISLIVSLLAIQRLGAVFAILPISEPKQLTKRKLELCKPVAILLLDNADSEGSNIAGLMAEIPSKLLVFSELMQLQHHMILPDVALDYDAPGYIAFTSGTTGVPKVVQGRAASLSRFGSWFAEYLEVGIGTRFAMLSGLAHDPLHRDIFLPLMLGACVHVPDNIDLHSSTELFNWLNKQQIEVLNITPSLGQLIWQDSNIQLSSVLSILLVGEPLQFATVKLIQQGAPKARITSLYGTTESSQALAYFPITSEHLEHAKLGNIVPVGKGIADVELAIISPDGQRCGLGEHGEIAIISDFVSLSVRQTDSLTAIHNDTRENKAPRLLYATGDYGIQNHERDILFTGRTDQQLSIRGFRVEIGEVYAAIMCHEKVSNAAVWLHEDGAQLVAAVVSREKCHTGSELLVREIMADLKLLLASYMLPAQLIVVENIPLTMNGKADYRTLQTLLSDKDVGVRVTPKTETEITLVCIICDLLQQDEVCMSKDLLSLGGNSLLVSRLITRIEKSLDIKTNFSSLIEAESLQSICAHLDCLIAEKHKPTYSLII